MTVLFSSGIILACIHFMSTDDLIFKKELTFQFREKVRINELIRKLNGRLVDNTYIDTDTVGKRKVKVSYYNHYGFIENKVVEVEIQDVTSPTIVVNSIYTVEKGSISNLLDTIFCADDYDDQVVCEIEGDYDLKRVGKYDLKITARDQSKNYSSKEFTLKVIEKEVATKPSEPKEIFTKFQDIRKKYKNNTTMVGLDLSKWQEEVDFPKIKEQGVEFVMIKIGGQKKKNGDIVMDPKFVTNIQAALENDLKVGVYFYSYATTTKEAIKQADWIVKNLKEYDITLTIAFDWENWSNYTSFHLSFHSLNNIAKAFLDRVEQRGYQSLLYSSKYYLENVWYEEEYTNWIAHYTTDSKDKENYYMWQLCSDGKIEGINGYVDIDIMYLKK